ncbi:VWA domain-containing protein [Longimicrobium sp.]|uniref:vWA domain-containing protein n=1 Tax=Longimicrobium sp. TaxID=2029185 RepID=UPI002BA9F1AC|nr:VWA domain-containing protein [Longimicrobium sp.]HSU15308.1 VWA domain-containing protein [Longimicrobium sp.]
MRTARIPTPLLLCILALAACSKQERTEPSSAPDVVAQEMPPPVVKGYQELVAPANASGVAADTRSASGGYAMVDSGFSREQYNPIAENEFKDAGADPLSTFAIDVDAASYANVRRFVMAEGRMPPRDAVRIEELVNYFDYDYADPRGDAPFSITTEVAPAPWNPAHRLVHVGLQGRRMDAASLPPANLVFLVDVSGSMDEPNKLPLLKEAFGLLVDNLRPQDRVSIVAYAGAAGMVLPPTRGSEKDRIRDAIQTLQPSGSTNGAEGIRLAYRLARDAFVRGGNNRVILATDGDFNVGVSSDAELVQLIEQERASGIFLTVLGFGTGNLQDAKMEQLADRGNGNYAYLDGIAEARKVLVGEMGGTLFTIAKDVKVQVEFNPARVKAYRLIGYENRLLAAEDFNDDRKDAGELGAGHAVTALYEVVPADAPDNPARGTDPLRYQQPRGPTGAAASGELLTVKLRYKAPDGDVSRLLVHPLHDRGGALSATSADFRFAAAVAEWGMLLRGSRFRGAASYGAVADLARGALGDDRGGYRGEFLRMVQASQRIASSGGRGEDDVAVER